MALRPRDVAISSLTVFIAWGLAVQQLPVLRYIGYAFVAGSILTLSWIVVLLLSIRSHRQISLGKDSEFRIPSLVTTQPWLRNNQWLLEQEVYEKRTLYPQSFVVSEALDGLLGQLLRDLVSSWYTSINRNSHFVNEIDRATRTALCGIRDRCLEEDTVEIIVLQIVPLITKHLKEFFEAERSVRGPNLDRNVTESEELDIAVARKYQDGKLHPAVSLVYSDLKLVQQEHLRKLVAKTIPKLLPETFLKSSSVTVLIREIVSCAVLAPIMQTVSDPDTWNQLLEAYVRFSEL